MTTNLLLEQFRSSSKNPNELLKWLTEINGKNIGNSSFPEFTKDVKAEIASVFVGHFGNPNFFICHREMLSLYRILSREKENIDELAPSPIVSKIIDIALPAKPDDSIIRNSFADDGQEQLERSFENEEKESTLKALCRRLATHGDPNNGKRTPIGARRDLLNFDLRLFFLLSAHNKSVSTRVRSDHAGLQSFADIMRMLLAKKPTLDDKDRYTLEQTLISLFNLMMTINPQDPMEIEDCQRITIIADCCHQIFLLQDLKAEDQESLDSHTINLMTAMPPDISLKPLTPLSNGPDSYMGEDITVVRRLLQFLRTRLNRPETDQREKPIIPILVLFTKLAENRRPVRKFLRQEILPPLKDEVNRRPEDGRTLRNRLTKLMTSSVTQTNTLAAELLFILCKRSVDRLIKYTGFGNAAGLLANEGLLGGKGYRSADADVDSPDEDSDTEEYKQALPKVNPVVGCVEEESKFDPFAGMSEEQKEYEAMKLVGEIDKLMKQGLIKPATIGEDGKPQPVEHILQLQDQAAQQHTTTNADKPVQSNQSSNSNNK